MKNNSVIDIKKGEKTIIIGEGVNPAGKPMLAAAMRDMDLEYIKKIIAKQIEKGSDIIDINVGTYGSRRGDAFCKNCKRISNIISAALLWQL